MGGASHLRNRGASGGGAGYARGSARRLAGECASFRVVTFKLLPTLLHQDSFKSSPDPAVPRWPLTKVFAGGPGAFAGRRLSCALPRTGNLM